jgi:hypothetical protein
MPYILKHIIKYYLLFVVVVIFSCNDNPKTEENIRQNETLVPSVFIDTSILISGDIILKKGKGMISSQIANTLNEPIPFSHCGILIKPDSGNIVIQSVAKEINGKDGVQAAYFSEIIKDIDYPNFYIVRLKNKELRKLLEEGAKEKLLEKAPFDYEFNHHENSKIYCTELVYLILKEKCNLDFFKIKKVQKNEFLLINSLLDNNYFEIVLHL